MSPVVMAILVLCLYVLFYRFYAKGILATKVFELDEHAPTPAHTMRGSLGMLIQLKNLRCQYALGIKTIKQ